MYDESTSRVNRFARPPLLTLARICLVPILVAAVMEGNYRLGLCCLVIAGLTDALDGTLARLLKQRSMLGQYLDPVADKLLLSALFLVLMHEGLIPVTVTVMVFGRDVGILLWWRPFCMLPSADASSSPASLARPTHWRR